MIKKILFLACIMLFTAAVPSFVEAKGAPVLQPYRMEDQVLTGTATPGESFYIYTKGALHSVRSDATGDFSLKLTEPIGPNDVTVFVKDDWGYDERQITYSPKNPPTPVEEKDELAVSYIGLTDQNEYYLSTSADSTIYAIYEGKTYTGKFGVAIPKGSSTEVKAYAKRDNGTKGEAALISLTTPTTIKMNPYDFNKKQVTGKSWPYALLELKDDSGNIGFTVAGKDGTFSFDKAWTVSELQHTQTLSVESGYVPVQSKTILNIKPYVATEEKPFYLLVNATEQKIEGMTFAGTNVHVDGKTCTTSSQDGTFSCNVPSKNEPIREISFSKDGKSVGTTLIELSSVIQEFLFQLDQAVTSEHPVLSGKSMPNRRFIATYGTLNLPFTSDKNGRFSLTLPKQYAGSFSVALLSLNNQPYTIKSWEIEDERPLLEPTTYTANGYLVLINRMKGLPGLEGEVLIEHEDGDIDIQQFTFPDLNSNGESVVNLEGIQPNDTYHLTLRTKEDKPREARFQGKLNPLLQVKLNPFKPYDQELTGTGEPGTSIQFNVPVVSTSSTRKDTVSYEGKVAENGTFSLKPKYPSTSKNLAIRYTGSIEATVKRPNTLDSLWYFIELQDETKPSLTAVKTVDNQSSFSIRSDDELEQLEVRYFNQEQLVKTAKAEFGWFNYYEIDWDPEQRMTFKKGQITRIEVRGKNKTGLISDWMSIPVLSSKIPDLSADEIFYGDRVVYANTNPNVEVKAVYNNDSYSVKSDKTGRVVIKLKNPIINASNPVTFTTKSEVGWTKSFNKKPIGFRVQNVHLNGKKDKIWFVTPNQRVSLSRYELKLNGKPVKLVTKDTNVKSVYSLPKAVKTPLQVELVLKNTNGTVKSTLQKTIKETYLTKKVSRVKISTKEKTIEGIAQPHHSIVIKDEKHTDLGRVKLYDNANFKITASRPLKIGKTIKMYSKDPFGQTSVVVMKVPDDVPPKVPTISKVTPKSTSITGKTEAKASVAIEYKKRVFWTKADVKGNYALKKTSFKVGESITVYAKDSAGNRSKSVTARVTK